MEINVIFVVELNRVRAFIFVAVVTKVATTAVLHSGVRRGVRLVRIIPGDTLRGVTPEL